MSSFNLTKQGHEHFKALCVFTKHMMASDDVDPLYPVLQVIQNDMSREQALWHSFLYVAWYNLPSATRAFVECPEPDHRILKKIEKHWPTGTERRANRGGKVIPHIADYLDELEEWPSQGQFYMQEADPDATTREARNANWHAINAAIQRIHGNGRWAAYKHCEVLRRVNGLPLEAPDAGHQFSTGPREGLHMLYGEREGESKDVIATLDAMTEDLWDRFEKRGLRMDIEYVETILCNYKSLAKGKYYVGHDIDELQEQIEKSHERGIIGDQEAGDLFYAREASLPHHYLGEKNNWEGIQKDRMKHFVKTGKIIVRRPKG